jgi:hypothetical protein
MGATRTPHSVTQIGSQDSGTDNIYTALQVTAEDTWQGVLVCMSQVCTPAFDHFTPTTVRRDQAFALPGLAARDVPDVSPGICMSMTSGSFNDPGYMTSPLIRQGITEVIICSLTTTQTFLSEK